MLAEWDLTICVRAAECVVFVLVFGFHLHYFAPAPVCKQDPLPGSVKTWRWRLIWLGCRCRQHFRTYIAILKIRIWNLIVFHTLLCSCLIAKGPLNPSWRFGLRWQVQTQFNLLVCVNFALVAMFNYSILYKCPTWIISFVHTHTHSVLHSLCSWTGWTCLSITCCVSGLNL